MRCSTDKWTLVVLWHVGHVADPSGIGRLADVCGLMLVLHRLRPTGILFYITVKMPPWPCGKKCDNLYVTIPVNATF